MKLRTSLAAAGAAVVLGTTGALVLPAVASAHSGTTTLKFTSVQKATVMLFVDSVSTPGTINAYPVSGSWTESSLTYDRQPSHGASIVPEHIPVSTASVNQ